MTLQEECVSLGVSTDKVVTLDLLETRTTSAIEWVRRITDFLKEHRLPDADFDPSTDYDGCLICELEATVPKTDDELRAEIEHKKMEVHRQHTAQLDREYAEYVRLKQKFDRQ